MMSFPIHTVDSESDYLLLGNDKSVCPYLEVLDEQ